MNKFGGGTVNYNKLRNFAYYFWNETAPIHNRPRGTQVSILRESLIAISKFKRTIKTASPAAQVIHAGLDGANTGAKATINSFADTAASTATLGIVDNLQVIPITEEEKSVYNLGYVPTRLLFEGGVGVATGGASKASTVGKAALVLDVGQNVSMVGQGLFDHSNITHEYFEGKGWTPSKGVFGLDQNGIKHNGFTVENSLQLGGGLVGLGGNALGGLSKSAKAADAPGAPAAATPSKHVPNSNGRNGSPAHQADVLANNNQATGQLFPVRIDIPPGGYKTYRVPDGVGQPGQVVVIRGQSINPGPNGRVIVESEHFSMGRPVSEGRRQIRDIRRAEPSSTIVVTDPNALNAPPLVYPPGTQPPPPGRLPANTPSIVPYP